MQHNHYEIWKPLRSPPRQGTLHPNCIQKAFLHIEDRHQALQAYHQGIGCSAAKPFGFLFLKLSHSVSKQKMQTHNHTNKFKLWSNNISQAQWSIRIFLHVKHHDAKSHAAAHVCCAAKQLRGLYSSPHRMTKPISTPCWVQQFGIWKRTTFPGLKFPTNNELKTTQVLQNGWQHP